jgi:hypothetical protein
MIHSAMRFDRTFAGKLLYCGYLRSRISGGGKQNIGTLKRRRQFEVGAMAAGSLVSRE